MTSLCATYSGTGTTWPVRPFPSSGFPRGSAARSRDAVKAWNVFERIEAYDADIRIKYSAMGGFTPSSDVVVTPTPWYIFKNESERVLYKRGQSLHRELCSNVDWTPQRVRGIPTTPLSDVYPGVCSEDTDRMIDIDIGTRNIVTASPLMLSVATPDIPSPVSSTTPSLMSRRASVRYRTDTLLQPLQLS